MKNKLLFFLALISYYTYAQIPSYYNNVDITLSGNALKNVLSNKVSTTQSTILSYTPGVWDALKQSDLDPSNPNKVLLIYGYNDNDGDGKTDRSRSKNNNGGGAGEWNREHTYARSLGLPNLGTTGAGADAHNLRPADIQMNSSRSNRKFAAGNGNAKITPQGNWYPGDEWKGDVARMMLFMYIRYGERCLPKNVGVGNAVTSDPNMVDVFLKWNAEDPVNAFEDNRNSVIAGIQGNRNPFVDNPAFATKIWGGVQAEDRFGTGNDDPTDPDNDGASELFISEYVEGSSFNKALEIANFTGNNVNLSGYNLRRQGNGSGNWEAAYNLSGTLNNGRTFVVSHSSASTTIKNKADRTTSSSPLTFNGNDAIGLFKNNVLIDIIGRFNGGTSNFAKDVTLRRKSSVSSPRTTYLASQWTRLGINTSSGLGTHVFSGDTNDSLNYCVSKGNDSSSEYIDYVGIGGINNSSGSNNGYKNNTSQVGNVSYGSNTVVISAGFSGQAYTEFWTVWIDYNQNGTFENSEKVVSGSSSSANRLSGTFTIPTSAKTGRTRMRVSMKYNAAQSACETFTYGEVEDYTLNISSSLNFSANILIADSNLENEEPLFNAKVFRLNSALVIKMRDYRAVNFTINNSVGQRLAKGRFKEQISINDLPSGVYVLSINDGQHTLIKKVVIK